MNGLALVEAPDHVCERYRIRPFRPALERAGWELTTRGLAGETLARVAQLVGAARFDAVILQRKLLPSWQLRLLRQAARRLVFDFDDAVMYRDSYDRRGPHCPRRARRFARTVQLADAVIAGNRFLADRAIEAGAEPGRVAVIPTCVDPDRYHPRDQERPARGLDLVWIGSSSTLQGLEAQRALLDRIGREVPGVRLRLICDRFTEFGSLPIVRIVWRADNETAQVAAGDVGISWLPDDLWSRGKCGLKVLQYFAAGLPVVANPVGVHSEMIADGRNGRLARTADEWVAAIRELAADPAGRLAMGRQARADLVQNYSVSAWEDAFVATLRGAARVPAQRRTGRVPRQRGAAGPVRTHPLL